MDENIYRILNDVTYNEEEFNNIGENLGEMDKKKISKEIKRKLIKVNNIKVKAAATAVIFIILMGTFLIKPAFADSFIENNPILDGMYEKMGYYKEFKDFTQYIGMSKENHGYKFTIDKLIADDDTVTVAMRIYKPGMNKILEADTKKTDKGSAYQFMITATASRVIIGGSEQAQVIDDDTSILIIKNEAAPDKEMPKRFDLTVNVHSMYDKNVNVNFPLKVSRENIQKATIVKNNIGKESLGLNGSIKFYKLKASPIDTSIKYSVGGNNVNWDNSGFYLYTDKGEVLSPMGSLNDDSGYSVSRFNRIDSNTRKLYIVPFIRTAENNYDKAVEQDSKLDFYNKEFDLSMKREFDLKENGKVTVYNVIRDKDSIRIYYKEEGKAAQMPADIHFFLKAKDEGKSIMMNDNINIYKIPSSEGNEYYEEFTNIDSNEEYKYIVSSGYHYNYSFGKIIEVDLKK